MAWRDGPVEVAHGVLEAIELDPAFDWSQVVVVDRRGYSGQELDRADRGLSAALVPIGGRVMHVDEALALVAAPTRR